MPDTNVRDVASLPGSDPFVRTETLYLPTGVLASTVSRRDALANKGLLTSGKQGLARIWLVAGTIVTNIAFFSGTTAAGTPTNQWFSLYDDALGKLAVTTDDTTTAWAANTLKTLALTTPYTILTDGYYRLGIMVAATTVPTLNGVAHNGNIPILGALPPVEFGLASDTGLTTPDTAPVTAGALGNTAPVPYAHIT